MRLSIPRPRFRLRTLLIAVAVGAVVLGLAVWLGRAVVDRRARAAAHRLEGYWRRADYIRFMESADGIGADRIRAGSDRFTRQIEYHEAMNRKWSQAAISPWLPVEPDPPPPE